MHAPRIRCGTALQYPLPIDDAIATGSARFESQVNGSVLVSYSYTKNLTRVFNIHSTDKTHGLGAEGLQWLTSTATQFAGDAAADPQYAALQAEYHSYYDPPADSAAH